MVIMKCGPDGIESPVPAVGFGTSRRTKEDLEELGFFEIKETKFWELKEESPYEKGFYPIFEPIGMLRGMPYRLVDTEEFEEYLPKSPDLEETRLAEYEAEAAPEIQRQMSLDVEVEDSTPFKVGVTEPSFKMGKKHHFGKVIHMLLLARAEEVEIPIECLGERMKKDLKVLPHHQKVKINFNLVSGQIRLDEDISRTWNVEDFWKPEDFSYWAEQVCPALDMSCITRYRKSLKEIELPVRPAGKRHKPKHPE
jgi:hypothetical protein